MKQGNPLHPASLLPYKYFESNTRYGTETLVISSEELKEIKKSPRTKVTPQPFPSPSKPVKCIIDTDIGTDFDDTMALLYALHLDDLEILGVTTNYGVSYLRAQVARKILNAYHSCHPDKPIFPVVVGASCQIGTHRDVFLHGNEGLPFFSPEEISELGNPEAWPSHTQTYGADFMAATVNQYPGEVTIISIGIPTNIAIAIVNHGDEFVSKVKDIIIMGGGSFMVKPGQNKSPLQFPDTEICDWVSRGKIFHMYPNHNLSGDTAASKIVFSSGIKMKVIPHDVTCKFWIKGEPIDFLRDKAKLENDKRNPKDPSGACGLLMLEWFARRHGQNGQCPHDPLTIHEAVFGEEDSPLLYVPGKLIIHEWAAFGTFIPDEMGKHYLAISTRNEAQFLERLGKSLMIDKENM